MINEKYWATFEKYKDSIENLKKLFTYVWENGNRDDYYKNLVGAFVEEISTLLKNDKKLSQYDTEPWTKTKTGKYTLELLMGLVSFRTFYKVKVNADVKSVDALFNEVFNEINKDSYYQSLIEHFKGNGEDVKKDIKHSWDCYFNQFYVLNSGKFENNELNSVVEQIKLDIVKQENNYFDEVEKYLKANGVEHPDLNNLCKKLQKEKLNKNITSTSYF